MHSDHGAPYPTIPLAFCRTCSTRLSHPRPKAARDMFNIDRNAPSVLGRMSLNKQLYQSRGINLGCDTG